MLFTLGSQMSHILLHLLVQRLRATSKALICVMLLPEPIMKSKQNHSAGFICQCCISVSLLWKVTTGILKPFSLYMVNVILKSYYILLQELRVLLVEKKAMIKKRIIASPMLPGMACTYMACLLRVQLIDFLYIFLDKYLLTMESIISATYFA